MLFNSYNYILLFLPISLIVYFFLTNNKFFAIAKIWLILSSFFFYGFWNPIYVPLLLTSIIINFIIGAFLIDSKKVYRHHEFILTIGIIFNVGFIAYYKYADFFIGNINTLIKTDFSLLHIVLPLGISFFTFQQISYIVDCYQQKVTEQNLINYSLFVSFFPQLIAGPIVRHDQTIAQFKSNVNKMVNWKNISAGIYLFFIGLFKKVMIADIFSEWANNGYSADINLDFFSAWATSMSYTMQIYFDFSAYTDMAIGSALLFNIKLPVNFNSPYKSLNIRDFWTRWHITLSRFLSSYVYIPLGGNRKGDYSTYRNLLITFFLGGLWHGAGWMFVIWGGLNGIALILIRLWQKTKIQLPKTLAWFITFNCINIFWVFFRAPNLNKALSILKGMIGYNGIMLPSLFQDKLPTFFLHSIKFGKICSDIGGGSRTILLLFIFMLIATLAPNSLELKDRFKPTFANLALLFIIASISFVNVYKVKEFLYFNF